MAVAGAVEALTQLQQFRLRINPEADRVSVFGEVAGARFTGAVSTLCELSPEREICSEHDVVIPGFSNAGYSWSLDYSRPLTESSPPWY